MLRVAVIGCRTIGIRHAQGAINAGDAAELVAGCDLSDELLSEFTDHFKVAARRVTTYTDFREMLSAEEPDVVTVATGDHQHADAVAAAAEAGAKGIFCEKPLATNLADADRMLEAVDKHDCILSIDHTRRWMPAWCYVAEKVIEAGEIGEVLTIVGGFSGERSMLFRNGTHVIDVMCWLADSDPEWVMAELEPGYEDYTEYRGDGGHVPETEPAAHGYIHFSNGVRAFYSGGPKEKVTNPIRVTVEGTLGDMQITENLLSTTVTVYKNGESRIVDMASQHSEAISQAVTDLIDVIENDGTPRSTGRDGMRVVEIMLGFLESQRQGNSRVQLPLQRS